MYPLPTICVKIWRTWDFFPLQEHDDVNCMASSPDGTVVILGKRSGLVVIDAHSHETLGCHATAASIIHVHVSQLGEEAHIAATIDNQGTTCSF